MDSRENWIDEEMQNSVNRWEAMIKSHQRYFFDVEELEDIIDYYLGNENIAQATLAADYAIGMYPTATSIQLRMADIMIDNGQPAKALTLLNKLEPLEANDYAIYLLKGSALNQMGKAREAQRQFEKALSMADEDQVPVLYEIGMSFARIDQFAVALRYFRKVRNLEPDNNYICYDLALCYDRLGELDKSIAHYIKFLDDEPFAEYAWYNLGVVYSRKEDDEKALEAYDYALAIEPQYSSALFNKANTLTIMNKPDEAITCFKEFIELEPDSAAGYCYLGECYDSIGDPDAAANCYNNSLALDSDFADAWYGLALLKIDEEQYAAALPLLLHAADLDKDNSEYMLSLATTYSNLHDFENAGRLFQQLLKAEPDDEEVWDCYAQFFAQQGLIAKAEAMVYAGLKRIPDSILLRYHLSVFCFLNGKIEQGLAILRETYAAHPAEVSSFIGLLNMVVIDDKVWDEVEKIIGEK